MVWLSLAETPSEKARETVSTPPPGGYGAIMRICLAGQACARTTAGAAKATAVVASSRRRDSDDMTIPPFMEDNLHAAAVPRTRAELVDVDALDAAQVD